MQPDLLYVVRHAKAGDRSAWVGDDRDRPLSGKGHAQADALAERLATLACGTVVASPYLRCVQTVAPLAERLGTAVTTDERLAEGRGFDGALELLATLPAGAVLCSHGDVIPDTMGALQRRGCRFVGAPDWRKGSVWVLTRVDGVVVEATAWPPP